MRVPSSITYVVVVNSIVAGLIFIIWLWLINFWRLLGGFSPTTPSVKNFGKSLLNNWKWWGLLLVSIYEFVSAILWILSASGAVSWDTVPKIKSLYLPSIQLFLMVVFLDITLYKIRKKGRSK